MSGQADNIRILPIQQAGSVLPDLLSPGHHDAGNAERLKLLHGTRLRYCLTMKKWLIFDDRRWAIDTTDRARRLAKETVDAFLTEARAAADKEAVDFALKSLNAGRIGSMLKMAASELPITPDELDQDVFALNFQNGTVDLRTGEIKQHNPLDFITKLVRFEYRPGADCSVFLAALLKLM
jgi:putative DNA primase/helicase